MKKFLNYRVLPFVCALSMLISLCVLPASAAEFPSELRDYDSVSDWDAKLLSSGSTGLNVIGQYLGVGVSPRDVFWGFVNMRLELHNGETSVGQLNQIAESFNADFNRPVGYTFPEQIFLGSQEVANDTLAYLLIGTFSPNFVVTDVPSQGVKRIMETNTGIFVVDSAGRYPYVTLDDGGIGSDQWVPMSSMNNGSYRMLSEEALYNLAQDVGGTRVKYNNYWCIKKSGSGVTDFVLANKDGKPYVCWEDSNQSATTQDRPTTNVTENGDIVEGDFTDNSVNLDLEGMTMLLPGGTFAFIDNLIYDESTKSYHIDSHDTINYTTNNYYTWNYYINYTSITYIGQTEEYNKYYEVYYELPDGRDSADLTKEDLEQLNLSVDVIPYGRSADDTSLRSLYHFDGDTKDSSYWNYCTDFNWNTGASLTYMDAGVFDGALYLDETEHDFTFKLPSNITSGDFTLQFRYYQSHTEAPQTDSYLKLGGNTVLQFSGGQFLDASGSALASTPVGSWNEVALMRVNGTVYYYLNGVSIGSAGFSGALSNTINFHFGSEQQTFKYFDELRFLNYALRTGGASYEPTAVPHDTNLSLVLPDSVVPVADEYWAIKSSGTNLFQYDLTTGVSAGFKAVGVQGYDDSTSTHYLYMEANKGNTYPTWGYCSDAMSFSFYDGYTTFLNSSNKSLFMDMVSVKYQTRQGLATQLWYSSTANNNVSGALRQTYLPNGTYTLSVVLADGSVSSYTFTTTAYGNSYANKYETFEWGKIGYRTYYGKTSGGYAIDSVGYAYIEPNVGQPVDIIYVELVSGSSTDLSVEFIESVTLMDKTQLNTPTLAVRTDIDITSHQIGGVRPSIPEKGQVWAMVENERIVSIQIYNGQAWEGVDGRIWTGQRWIPASSYNIITLQDMYDIVDATPNYEYIYSEAGFWAWWQKSWNAFTEKLFQTLGSGGAGSSGASGGFGSNELHKVDLDAEDPVSDPDQEDGKTLWQFIVLVVNGGKSVVSGTREMFSGVVSTIPDTMDDITGAFDSGGVAVGVFDGSDPDSDSVESEVLDPWRYR